MLFNQKLSPFYSTYFLYLDCVSTITRVMRANDANKLDWLFLTLRVNLICSRDDRLQLNAKQTTIR